MTEPRRGPDASTPERQPAPSSHAALLAADREDLERTLASTRAAARRHTLWAALGVSPGAVLPFLFAMSELGVLGVVTLAGAVAAVEAYRAHKANLSARDLERRLRELERS